MTDRLLYPLPNRLRLPLLFALPYALACAACDSPAAPPATSQAAAIAQQTPQKPPPTPETACAVLADGQRAITGRIAALRLPDPATAPMTAQTALTVIESLQAITADIDALYRDWLPTCRLALSNLAPPAPPSAASEPADASEPPDVSEPTDAPSPPATPTTPTTSALLERVYLPHMAHLLALRQFTADAAARLPAEFAPLFQDVSLALADAIAIQQNICASDLSAAQCAALAPSPAPESPQTPNPDASP